MAEVYNFKIKKLLSIFREPKQILIRIAVRNTKYREILVFSYFVDGYVMKIWD
ncbi:hypothetical protein P872_09825 [Rhodonellum psychrophilum GCM71 = DSM 17998]|uniref:Uncharacterized protein n=2 Tax=Rhodonellum TaxID=336827 RepID=U5BM57_9BACT|nr:hypothetical protein P872_09825 [Rhodonellum psychrophilum GCM71 = DSM 17998]SDZ54017.1 hypothetical protein SAMN05444412_1222 [Rhodonellum ikkaensis]